MRSSTPPPTLIKGDCLTVMRRLARVREPFHLIYLDPPFMTGRVFRTGDGEVAYDDRWPSPALYRAWLQQRFAAARDILDPTGSIVVHVDPKVSHLVRVELDEVFGPDAFASEIVWRYRRWPAKTENLQRVHDVLIRYVRDPNARPRFQRRYEPLSASTLATWGTRRQRVGEKAGDRRRSSVSTDEVSPGAALGDVWELPIVAPSGRERARGGKYPTQKPEALLERLIDVFTLPGDRVLDFCCGSGTTVAVAHRLGRVAVGIDQSHVAIRTARARLGGA